MGGGEGFTVNNGKLASFANELVRGEIVENLVRIGVGSNPVFYLGELLLSSLSQQGHPVQVQR